MASNDGGHDEARRRDELADALSRMEHDMPSEQVPLTPPPPVRPPDPLTPPASAAEFRRSSRPATPPGSSAPPPPPRPIAPPPPPAPSRASAPNPAPAQSPVPSKPKAARPQRPDRPPPDRPVAPPTTVWSEDEAAAVAAHYEPLSEVFDDDTVMVPAPAPEVFAPHPPIAAAAAPAALHAVHIPKSLGFRRTVIPVLLTCGVLLIGIGLLRWLGGGDSIFADMTIPMSATLCGSGFFLLIVAVLNMLQVKAELAAAARRRA
jgi:hypothetical protein